MMDFFTFMKLLRTENYSIKGLEKKRHVIHSVKTTISFSEEALKETNLNM